MGTDSLLPLLDIRGTAAFSTGMFASLEMLDVKEC